MALAPGTLGGPGLPDKVRIAEATLHTGSIMEQDRWGHFISDIERSGDKLLEKLGEKMEEKARRFAPVRTGRLRNSITWVPIGSREITLYTDVPYAGVMEKGSHPHYIHGVRANFDWKGGRFVWNDPKYGPIDGPRGRKEPWMNWSQAHGATVRHPGTKPRYFMARAFTETWQEARFIMRQVYG